MKLGEMRSKMPCAAFGCFGHFQQATKLLHPGVQGRIYPFSFSISWAVGPCCRTALRTGLPQPRASAPEAAGSITHSQSAARSQACSEAPAAKCKQVSPLTATPAAQPAVTQPAASLGHPASGCTLCQQPSFFQWVRPRPFLLLCEVIVPSPSPEMGPCAFVLGHGAVHAVPCMQTPACCSGGVDINFPILSTSFEVLFFCPLLTKTMAAKIQIKKTHKYSPIAAPLLPPAAAPSLLWQRLMIVTSGNQGLCMTEG